MTDFLSRKYASLAMGRREFLGKLGSAAAGAAALGLLDPFVFARDAMSAEPSIKITSIDRAQFNPGNGTNYVIRINTNKGISGYGEIHTEDSNGATEISNMWSTLKGMNPTQIDKIWAAIKNTGSPSDRPSGSYSVNSAAGISIPRKTGGITAVETACWDILGKVHNVPVWSLLGKKQRDSMRMYCDTDQASSSLINTRLNLGFTWFKCDYQFNNGTSNSGSSYTYPYTYLHIKDFSGFQSAMRTYRSMIGTYPLSTDHDTGWLGPNYIDVESAVQFATVAYANDCLGPYGGWVEDIIPWWYSKSFSPSYPRLTDIHTNANFKAYVNNCPILTGEDMYSFAEFKTLIDDNSIDIIHPDPACSGGIAETARAALYGASKGVKTAFHNSNGPLAAIAMSHIAAVIPEPYFCACECHYPDSFSTWQSWVDGIQKPIWPATGVGQGCIPVPDGPGIGCRPSSKYTFSNGWLT